MSERFDSFEEFWPFYVSEHSDATNRLLHFVGTGAALTALGVGLLTRRKWLIALAPVLGYGPAWLGHFLVERNVPATFEHPLWSLRADILMFKKMLDGTMRAEVERVTAVSNTDGDLDDSAHRDDESNGGSTKVRVTFEAAKPIDPSTLN